MCRQFSNGSGSYESRSILVAPFPSRYIVLPVRTQTVTAHMKLENFGNEMARRGLFDAPAEINTPMLFRVVAVLMIGGERRSKMGRSNRGLAVFAGSATLSCLDGINTVACAKPWQPLLAHGAKEPALQFYVYCTGIGRYTFAGKTLGLFNL